MTYSESLEKHIADLEQRLADVEQDLSKWKPKWIKTERLMDENYEFVVTSGLYGLWGKSRFYSFGSVWRKNADNKYHLFFKRTGEEVETKHNCDKAYDTAAEAMKAFEEEILTRHL
jgi:hypothetical protein